MDFLLDTSAFSDLMREHAKVAAHLARIGPAKRAAICSIVRGEIAYGIGRHPEAKKRQALEAKVAKLFSAFSCEPAPRRRAITTHVSRSFVSGWG